MMGPQAASADLRSLDVIGGNPAVLDVSMFRVEHTLIASALKIFMSEKLNPLARTGLIKILENLNQVIETLRTAKSAKVTGEIAKAEKIYLSAAKILAQSEPLNENGKVNGAVYRDIVAQISNLIMKAANGADIEKLSTYCGKSALGLFEGGKALGDKLAGGAKVSGAKLVNFEGHRVVVLDKGSAPQESVPVETGLFASKARPDMVIMVDGKNVSLASSPILVKGAAARVQTMLTLLIGYVYGKTGNIVAPKGTVGAGQRLEFNFNQAVFNFSEISELASNMGGAKGDADLKLAILLGNLKAKLPHLMRLAKMSNSLVWSKLINAILEHILMYAKQVSNSKVFDKIKSGIEAMQKAEGRRVVVDDSRAHVNLRTEKKKVDPVDKDGKGRREGQEEDGDEEFETVSVAEGGLGVRVPAFKVRTRGLTKLNMFRDNYFHQITREEFGKTFWKVFEAALSGADIKDDSVVISLTVGVKSLELNWQANDNIGMNVPKRAIAYVVEYLSRFPDYEITFTSNNSSNILWFFAACREKFELSKAELGEGRTFESARRLLDAFVRMEADKFPEEVPAESAKISFRVPDIENKHSTGRALTADKHDPVKEDLEIGKKIMTARRILDNLEGRGDYEYRNATEAGEYRSKLRKLFLALSEIIHEGHSAYPTLVEIREYLESFDRFQALSFSEITD
jgi:hypothetical protein